MEINEYKKMLKEFFWNKQQKLPEFVDANDPSLPNPYNFRQLKLDPKVTKEDIRKADIEWRKIIEKGWTRFDFNLEKGFAGVIEYVKKWSRGTGSFTIVDKGKRVGIVAVDSNFEDLYESTANLTYVTWVHGKNYAAAGCMKLLNMPQIPQFKKEGNKINFTEIYIDVHRDNTASLKVVKNLKAQLNRKGISGILYYSLRSPYWWNNYKLLKY